MSHLMVGMRLLLVASLMGAASAANAATLTVNCGARVGLVSVGEAIKVLQRLGSHGPDTILVSGGCRENVAILGAERLTLTAVNGASISDVSGGKLDVINVSDSFDVTISGFTITAGADGSTGANGISCGDGSLCRVTNVTVQGAGDGAGVAVFTLSRARLTAVTMKNNAYGLQMVNGANVLGDATMQGNWRGMQLVTGAVANIHATITQSADLGIYAANNSAINCLACVISGNATGGVLLRVNSSSRFASGYSITNNGGSGVMLSEVSSALFQTGAITGNAGNHDVECGPQFTSASGATTNIGGGSTNCSEP